MAIAATFLANFDQFESATEKAGGKLLTFSARADAVGGRLMDLGDSSERGAPKVKTLSDSFHAFDGALSSVGVHIGPEIRALEELGNVSGKTAGQLGILTTAGLAAAAFMVGWKIGGLIADMTSLDEKVESVAKRLFNWGDEGQRAGAKADVLALATKNAGREITDYSEAIKINAAAAEQQALVWGRSANAARDSAREVSGWQKELRDARSRGDIPSLTADLNSQAFSLQTLSTRYGLSMDALQLFVRQQQAAEAQLKKTTAAQAEQAKGWEQFYDWVADQEAARQKDADAALRKDFERWRDREKLNAQIAANADQTNRILGQAAMDAAVAEEKARFAAQGVNAELTKMPPVAASAASSVMSLGSAASSAASSFFSMSAELFNAIRAAQAADSMNDFIPAMGRIGGGGISGLRPLNPIIRPTTGGAFGGVNVTINGSVLGNKDEIARVVGDALMYQTTGSGQRVASRA